MYVSNKKSEQDLKNTEVKYSEDLCKLQNASQQLQLQQAKVSQDIRTNK